MQPKTERYTVQLLESDKQALERLARVEGESMAVVVRRMIRKAANERGVLRATQPAGQRETVTHDTGN